MWQRLVFTAAAIVVASLLAGLTWHRLFVRGEYRRCGLLADEPDLPAVSSSG